TDKGVLVVAAACTGRQLLDSSRIAAAEDDVVGDHCRLESQYHIVDSLAPTLLAQALEPAQADIVFEGLALAIRQMGQFQRSDHMVDDERRPEPGAQAEKKHAAACIAAERLH